MSLWELRAKPFQALLRLAAARRGCLAVPERRLRGITPEAAHAALGQEDRIVGLRDPRGRDSVATGGGAHQGEARGAGGASSQHRVTARGAGGGNEANPDGDSRLTPHTANFWAIVESSRCAATMSALAPAASPLARFARPRP